MGKASSTDLNQGTEGGPGTQGPDHKKGQPTIELMGTMNKKKTGHLTKEGDFHRSKGQIETGKISGDFPYPQKSRTTSQPPIIRKGGRENFNSKEENPNMPRIRPPQAGSFSD